MEYGSQPRNGRNPLLVFVLEPPSPPHGVRKVRVAWWASGFLVWGGLGFRAAEIPEAPAGCKDWRYMLDAGKKDSAGFRGRLQQGVGRSL